MGLFGPPDIEKMKTRHDVKGLTKTLYYKHGSFAYDHRRIREKAAIALGELKAVEPLIAALKDYNGDIRIAAMGALGTIGDPRAIEPIIIQLKRNPGYDNYEERRAAAEALGKIGGTAVVEPLIAALKDDKHYTVCCAAAKALGEINDSRVVKPLVAALTYNVLIRNEAAEALGKVGALAVEPLIAALANPQIEVVRVVVKALGNIKDARAADALVDALQNCDRALQGDIVNALKNFDDERSVQIISEIRNTHLERRIRLEKENPVGPRLTRVLEDLEHKALPALVKSDESAIKAEWGLYGTYVKMTGHWHGFEGTREEAFEHLWIHFSQDHPESAFSCTTQVEKDGSQLNILANTPRVGYQHFVWRTKEDKYVLMVSDSR